MKKLLLTTILLIWGTYWGQAQTKYSKKDTSIKLVSTRVVLPHVSKTYTGITTGSQFAFTQDVNYGDSVIKYTDIVDYYREYGNLSQYQQAVNICQVYVSLAMSHIKKQDSIQAKIYLEKKYHIRLDSLIKITNPSHRP